MGVNQVNQGGLNMIIDEYTAVGIGIMSLLLIALHYELQNKWTHNWEITSIVAWGIGVLVTVALVIHSGRRGWAIDGQLLYSDLVFMFSWCFPWVRWSVIKSGVWTPKVRKEDKKPKTHSPIVAPTVKSLEMLMSEIEGGMHRVAGVTNDSRVIMTTFGAAYEMYQNGKKE